MNSFLYYIAPMVGISNICFRQWVTRRYPHAFVFSEMLSAKRLACSGLGQTLESTFLPFEPQTIVQLAGDEPSYFEKGVLVFKESVGGFDINMGCPAKHIQKHSWGVKLTEDPQKAFDIVQKVCSVTSLPVSVKLRIMEEDQQDKLFLFLIGLKNAGASFVTIHARTLKQKHKGKAKWDDVAFFLKESPLPIIINGGIQDRKDFLYLENLGFKGVMLGRGFLAKPWILGEQEPFHFLEDLLEFINIYKEYVRDEKVILERMRFYLSQTVPWYNYGHYLWSKSMKAKNVADLILEINKLIDSQEFRLSSTKVNMT